MLGFNGGLMGVRRTPTTGTASGLWFQNEQSVAKRAEIWPRVITDVTASLSPVLWYDFNDASKVTLSGSTITQIDDKGSRGWNLTKSPTGPTQATWTNNANKCLNWGSSGAHSNYMRNTNTTSTTIGEVYVVVDASFGGTLGSNYGGLFTGTSGSGWYMLAFGTAMTQSGTGFDRMFINGGAANRFSSIFTSPSIDSPAILRLNNSSGATFNTAEGFEIGQDRQNWDLQRGWSGLVGEYIVFSSVLSSTNRDSLQEWLAFKWGITLVA